MVCKKQLPFRSYECFNKCYLSSIAICTSCSKHNFEKTREERQCTFFLALTRFYSKIRNFVNNLNNLDSFSGTCST